MADSWVDGLAYELMGTPLWAYVALVATFAGTYLGIPRPHTASGVQVAPRTRREPARTLRCVLYSLAAQRGRRTAMSSDRDRPEIQLG
jgi:hypothetical protein